MRSMTAAYASRNFDEMLDAVERGEEVLLTRDGATIARLVPRRPGIAARIDAVMEKHPLPAEAVDEWERAINDLREWQDDREREWPAN